MMVAMIRGSDGDVLLAVAVLRMTMTHSCSCWPLPVVFLSLLCFPGYRCDDKPPLLEHVCTCQTSRNDI